MSLNHKHSLFRLHSNPKDLKDLELDVISDTLQYIVERINMNVLMGPFITYCDTVGNLGWTGVVVIETSHLSFHAWEETGLIQADLYSCADFDPEIVAEILATLFNSYSAEIFTVDRNEGLAVGEKTEHLVKGWTSRKD